MEKDILKIGRVGEKPSVYNRKVNLRDPVSGP